MCDGVCVVVCGGNCDVDVCGRGDLESSSRVIAVVLSWGLVGGDIGLIVVGLVGGGLSGSLATTIWWDGLIFGFVWGGFEFSL